MTLTVASRSTVPAGSRRAKRRAVRASDRPRSDAPCIHASSHIRQRARATPMSSPSCLERHGRVLGDDEPGGGVHRLGVPVGDHARAFDLAAQAHAIDPGARRLVGHSLRALQAADLEQGGPHGRQQLGAGAVAGRQEGQRALEEGDLRRQVAAPMHLRRPPRRDAAPRRARGPRAARPARAARWRRDGRARAASRCGRSRRAPRRRGRRASRPAARAHRPAPPAASPRRPRRGPARARSETRADRR